MTSALFVVESGYAAGLGHWMRCRALAEELAGHLGRSAAIVVGEAKNAAWPSGDVTPVAEDRVATEIERRLTALSWDWLISDGYRLDVPALHAVATRNRARTLCLDDEANRQIEADIVLNPNTTDASLYRSARVGNMLLGPRYALIGSEFRELRWQCRGGRDASRIVISFGGVDRRDRTRRAAELIRRRHPDAELVAILGPYYAFEAQLRESVPGLSAHRAPADFAAMIASADLLVTAAGSTVWQALSLGLPSIAVRTTENQAESMRTLEATGAAVCLDATGDPATDAGLRADRFHAALDRAWSAGARLELSRAARTLVDGQGARRVAEHLLGIQNWDREAG